MSDGGLSKVNYYAHTSPLFKRPATLKLEHLCTLHGFAFYYKFENNLLPEYINLIKSNLQAVDHNWYITLEIKTFMEY